MHTLASGLVLSYPLLGVVETRCCNVSQVSFFFFPLFDESEYLTLEERPLGREVKALVEKLGPLLAQVVTEGADAAVEDAGMVSGGRSKKYVCDLQSLDRDVSEAENGDGGGVVCSLLVGVKDQS